MEINAVATLFTDLQESELIVWIERGWVRPEPAATGWVFQEIDVARVRLIHDLRRSMAVDEETVPLVLSLLDQVYTLRSELNTILRVVERQQEPVRTAILTAVRR